jgi:methyl-accepting chemotaxis protein
VTEDTSKRDEGDSTRGGRSLRSRLTPGFIRRRYAAKFVVSILVVVLVISAAGWVNYVEARDTVEDNTQSQLQSTVHLQSDAVNEWNRNMEGQTRTASDAAVFRTDDRGAIRDHLNATTENTDPIKAVHYVDTANGTVAASSAPGLEGEDLDAIEMPWSEMELDGDDDVWTTNGSYWSPLLHEHEVVAFASAVPERDRAVVVVGGFYHRLDDLHQPGSEQMTWIVDTDGETVLTSNNTNVAAPGDTAAHVEAMTDGAGGDDHDHQHGGVAFREADGHLLAYAQIQGTDWVAVAAVDTGSAYAARDTVARSVLSIVGAGLLSLFLVGVVLGRQTILPLSELRRKTRQMESGDLNVDLTTGRRDEVGRLYDGFAAMRDALDDRIREANDARQEAEEMNRHLEATADEYREVMQACAEGDLTRRLDPDEENEAMAEIAHSFNRMVAELEATAARLNRFADQVAGASEQVTASTEEVGDASEQVSESMQEIADGADRQDDLLQSVASEMEDLATTIQAVATTSNDVAEIAERSAQTGREGRETARAAVEGMRRIEAESEETVTAIERLEAEMAEIDELAETITDIVEQTNMLALNANIEASRSSGSTDGFVAVAKEVKDLAEQTRTAAEDIEARIDRLKEQTGRTADEVRETSEQVARHADTVEDAAASLEDVVDHAEETNDGVQAISRTTRKQAASIKQVVALTDDAATVSERTNAEAETVTAAAEEQTNALGEVSRSAADLAYRARRLSDALDDFETDVDDEAGESGDPDETGDVVFAENSGESAPADSDDAEWFGETRDERTTSDRR